MTREELIYELNNRIGFETDNERYAMSEYEKEFYRSILNLLEQEPCEDCISRRATIDLVRKWFDKIQLNGDICLDGIISLPSVTPQPKTGHWIKCEDDYYDWFECSECRYGSEGEITNDNGITLNYCPKCGADMRESEVEE